MSHLSSVTLSSDLTRTQPKSHLPWISVVTAKAQPDQSHDFDEKIGIWRICVLKTVKSPSKGRREESTAPAAILTAPPTPTGSRPSLVPRRTSFRGHAQDSVVTFEGSGSAAGRHEHPPG